MKAGVLISGVVILMVTLAYFLRDLEDQQLTAQSRLAIVSDDRKDFVTLKDGVVHYEFTGQKSGPVVVLTHGVSGPMIVWDKTFATLKAAGFSVLRYDLYGRGFSDRPDSTYNLDLYIRELSGLLDELRIDGPVDLIGSSMGCIISSQFTVQFANRVRKVAFVGPAGFPLHASPLAKLTAFPFIGDYLMGVVGDALLHQHNRNYFFRPESFLEFQKRFEDQLRFKGSKRAILSTVRSTPLQAYLPGYESLGEQGRTVLLVWGKEDKAFPFNNHEKAMTALKKTDFISVADAGHLPQYEQPEMVNEKILNFLRN